ncbi:MAG: molybdopterin dinucleotide binding domain-containing protein [Pseudomonadota bacterium]
MAEPYIEIHPDDAQAIKVQDAELIQVDQVAGTFIGRALITTNVRKGELFAPMHWTRHRAPESLSNRPVDVPNDPYSGQPALKSAQVSAQKFPAKWYAFIASIYEPDLPQGYAAKARTQTGWQIECAGLDPLGDFSAFVSDLVGSDECEEVSYSNATNGDQRLALTKDGVLQAVAFLSTTSVELSRNAVIGLIGTEVSGLDALAGKTAADKPDEGATVCACFGVGENRILSAIAGGADTIEAIGNCTMAGTNCGSCRPELSSLLGAERFKLAAE